MTDDQLPFWLAVPVAIVIAVEMVVRDVWPWVEHLEKKFQ